MQPPDLSAKPLKTRIIWREEAENQFLVYNPASDMLHMFRPLGMRILILCDGNRTIEQIIQTIAEETKLPLDNVRERIVKFIFELEQKKLVEIK
ncbi:MAG: PqqD family protein [Candidatus Bathyarchaeota archaeon]|nr:PqqD family protein [Candidatus Bathyarchaeota archaeon]